MSFAINQIVSDAKQQQQQDGGAPIITTNDTISTDIKSVLDGITDSMNSSDGNNSLEQNVDRDSITSAPLNSSSSNDYDTIMDEIQSHEKAMEVAVSNAEQISKELKDSILYYLKIRSSNRNGILFRGVPDVLQASARLLDISISGRYKIASLKKLRASIIKDKNGGANSKDDLNLMSFLNED